MLERIRQGSLDPDATRSEMMETDVKVEVFSVEEDDEPLEPVQRQHRDLDEEAGEDLGPSCDTSSSSEEEQAAEFHAARIVSAPKAPPETEVRQHQKSKRFHVIHEDHKLYLRCVREVEITNRNLSTSPASLGWVAPCCSQCWRHGTYRLPPDCGKSEETRGLTVFLLNLVAACITLHYFVQTNHRGNNTVTIFGLCA